MGMKTFYFTDPLHDDFAEMNIQKRTIDESFTYAHTALPWKICANVLYYGLGVPLGWLIGKVWFGVRLENRSVMRRLPQGCFLYGNHTQAFTDAACPAVISFPKRAYIVAGAETASIKGITALVQMLGALILPTELSGMKKFKNALELRCAENSVITIFPEAHLWPYYTGVRPFVSDAFSYPVKYNKPVVVAMTTYRKRFLRCLPPAVTVTLSDPIFPDPSASPREARQKLRDAAYAFMCTQAKRNEVEHVRYIDRSGSTE